LSFFSFVNGHFFLFQIWFITWELHHPWHACLLVNNEIIYIEAWSGLHLQLGHASRFLYAPCNMHCATLWFVFYFILVVAFMLWVQQNIISHGQSLFWDWGSIVVQGCKEIKRFQNSNFRRVHCACWFLFIFCEIFHVINAM